MPTLLTEDLILSLAYSDDPQLSPDGSRVVYVAACDGQEGDHPEGTIWVAPTDIYGKRWQYNHLHPLISLQVRLRCCQQAIRTASRSAITSATSSAASAPGTTAG